jgi:hypothetical protein
MGAVITFPQARRTLSGARPQALGSPAQVIVILPVIRIERDAGSRGDARTDPSKSPSGGKRGRRASRT